MKTISHPVESLTVPHTSGQTEPRHFHNEMTGFDSPTLEAQDSRATPAAFLCQYGSPYNGRAVWEGAIPAGPRAGLSTRTVPPTRLTAGQRSYRPLHEDFTMPQDNSARASRAHVTQSRIHANGTTDTITWVREATCIKRLRRHLAKSGCSLHITREGSPDRQRHGEYFIRDEEGRLIDDKISLEAWLRAYNLLADGERIDPPLDRGWKFYIARQRKQVIDGISYWHNDQLTGIYSTEKAARKAADGIEDRENLVVVGFDARAKGGTHDE